MHCKMSIKSLTFTKAMENHTGWPNACTLRHHNHSLPPAMGKENQPQHCGYLLQAQHIGGLTPPNTGSGQDSPTESAQWPLGVLQVGQGAFNRNNSLSSVKSIDGVTSSSFGFRGCCLLHLAVRWSYKTKIILQFCCLLADRFGSVLLGNTQRTYWKTRKHKEKSALGNRFSCSIPLESSYKWLQPPPAAGIDVIDEWMAFGFCIRVPK